MSGWGDAAIAATLLITAAARSVDVTPLHADPARRWLVFMLAALGAGSLLHALLAADMATSRHDVAVALWFSDVATMIAAACMVGAVAPDREHDPHTTRLCAHAWVVTGVALMMAAQLLAFAKQPAVDQHGDAVAYLLPYVGYIIVAFVGTAHGFRQQWPMLTRARVPAITVAIIGGAWAGIIGTAWQRLSAMADPPRLLAVPRVTHLGVALEITGHLTLIAGLTVALVIPALRNLRKRRQHRALEPLWRIVTHAALHHGHVSQALAVSAIHGDRLDPLYGRVIEIIDAWHVLKRYAPDPESLGQGWRQRDRRDAHTVAAQLYLAIRACCNGDPPRTDIDAPVPVPDHRSVEALAPWLIDVGTFLTDSFSEDIAHAAGSCPSGDPLAEHRPR